MLLYSLVFSKLTKIIGIPTIVCIIKLKISKIISISHPNQAPRAAPRIVSPPPKAYSPDNKYPNLEKISKNAAPIAAPITAEINTSLTEIPMISVD